jgi:hypothetical protein
MRCQDCVESFGIASPLRCPHRRHNLDRSATARLEEERTVVVVNLPQLSAFGFEFASGLLFTAHAAVLTAGGAAFELVGLVTAPLIFVVQPHSRRSQREMS